MNQFESEQIILETETRQKIGAVTYVVTAHFDEAREPLNHKIVNLLKDEIDSEMDSRQLDLATAM